MSAVPMPAFPQTQWLLAQLDAGRHVLHEMGPNFSGLETRMEELHGRLETGCFRLAVLGQFKRGKSTLLNALLGEPLLPTGILPVTAIPTILRYGAQRRVRVIFFDGHCEAHQGSPDVLAKILARHVTEEANPANRLGIARVEVEHPGELLAKGVEIIDTPGIGSTMLHNTRTARETVPVCDGALFVLSPDPPITEAEAQFLRAVKDAVARIMCVLTKADLLNPTERHEMLGFMGQVVQGHAECSVPLRIFPVSALQALQARSTRSEDAWRESGLGELEAYLTRFLLAEKTEALQDAIRGKGSRVIGEALFALDLQRKAIELPRHELERRSSRLETHLAKVQMERVYFRDRLAGDRRRLLDDLDRLSKELSGRARDRLTRCFQKVRRELGPHAAPTRWEQEAHLALSAMVDEIFERAAGEVPATTETRFHEVQQTHCRHVESLLDQIRRSAADLFEVACLEGATLDRVEPLREPLLVRRRWVTSFTEEAGFWLTRLLPGPLRAKRLERKIQEEIDYLVARNAEELRWATRQNVENAIRSFQARLEAQIDAAIHTIRTAVQTALDSQSRREARSVPELERLATHVERLEELRAALSPTAGTQPGSPV